MKKGESTRQRIIEQAAPLFNQLGFEGCSMQDVLEATGLEKGGLYRHFASKEELAAEAFRFAWAQSVKLRLEGLDQVQGAVEKLRFLVRQFARTPGPIPGGCPLMNTAIDADDGNRVLRSLAHAGVKDWKKRLCAIVKKGIEAGEIRSDVEPRQIANAMIAALEGGLMISRLEGNRTALCDTEIMLESMLDAIAAG
jgi:AcrR family transcriptional regulator